MIAGRRATVDIHHATGQQWSLPVVSGHWPPNNCCHTMLKHRTRFVCIIYAAEANFDPFNRLLVDEEVLPTCWYVRTFENIRY